MITALIVFTGTACDQLLDLADSRHEGGSQPTRSRRPSTVEEAPVTQALPEEILQMDERERYCRARAAIACQVEFEDRAEHATLISRTQARYGFNQMTYTAAAHRYRGDAEGKALSEEAEAECRQRMEQQRQQELLSAINELAADQSPLAHQEEAPHPDATTPPSPASAPGDAAEGDLPSEPHPLAGRWTGNLSGAESGTVTFTISPAGRVEGTLRILGRGSASLRLEGSVGNSEKISIKASGTDRQATHLVLDGKVNETGRTLSGRWHGPIARKETRGSWRANRR